MVVLALSYALPYIGIIDVQESDIAAFVDAAMKVVSFILMCVSQFQRPDLVIGLIRKN